MASARARPPPATGLPARKSFPYVFTASGQAAKSPGTSGEGSPVMLIVPSMLPVGPEYGGSFCGLTNAATLALGRGVPFAGVLGAGGGANAVASAPPVVPVEVVGLLHATSA